MLVAKKFFREKGACADPNIFGGGGSDDYLSLPGDAGDIYIFIIS